MSVYFGGSKIKDIYVGSTKIGKVYHGSTLVYESGPSLKLYGTTFNQGGSQANGYLIGSWSTSGILSGFGIGTISSISGTLGSSGSTITVNSGEEVPINNALYNKTFTVNGVNVYLYKLSDFFDFYICVMEKSKVNSCVIWGIIPVVNPTSVTTTTATGGGYTHTKDSSRDATWYLSGVR